MSSVLHSTRPVADIGLCSILLPLRAVGCLPDPHHRYATMQGIVLLTRHRWLPSTDNRRTLAALTLRPSPLQVSSIPVDGKSKPFGRCN